MDSITPDTLHVAAAFVGAVWELEADDVHTVTITLNGQHGGADVIVEYLDEDGHNVVRKTIVPR